VAHYLLLGRSLALTLLLLPLVDQLLLQGGAFMRLLFKPCLLLDNDLLLPLLKVFLMLNLFLVSEFFSQSMRLGVLALLDKSFKDGLVLQKASTGLEPESFIQVLFKLLSQLHQLVHVALLEGFQVSLTALYELFFMLVPIALKVTNVFLLLLEKLIHLNIVLSQDGTAPLVVFLVSQLFNFGLSFLRICTKIMKSQSVPSLSVAC